MNLINFKTPELSDMFAAMRAVADSGYIGSDAGFANIYLLRKKYDTMLALQEGFLFRYYNGQGSRRGYAFPLGAEDPHHALDLIVNDALESGRPLEFCLVDEPRAEILRDYFTRGLDDARIGQTLHFEHNRGDSDYIYSAVSLANLSGTTYRKKRNHISKFSRTYAHYELREITRENITEALEIEKKWLNGLEGEPRKPTRECEQDAWAERSEDEKSRLMEFCAIQEALQNFEELGFKGGLLYVEDKPVGMTLASEIAPGVWDIHFEKVIDEYAINGGYAVINKMFAETLTEARLLNREEDVNLEGLRKAKLSYYPLIILDKCHVTVLLDRHSGARGDGIHKEEG